MSKKEQARAKAKAMAKWDKSLWSLIDTQQPPSTGGGPGSTTSSKGIQVSDIGPNTWASPWRVGKRGNWDWTGSKYYHHDYTAQDIAMPEGTPLYAVMSGKVLIAGMNGGYGNNLRIASNGWVWNYGHMRAGRPFAKGIHPGAHVQAGQLVGWSGNTGHSTGPHLHLDVTKNGGGLRDPIRVLEKHGIKFADGGVVTEDTFARIGEAGSNEAVIPLNNMGVGVIADAIAQYSHTYEARASRTAGRGVVINAPVTYHQDHSTRITGPITVKTNDVNDLTRQLERRARTRRMVNPMGST